jgi:hypothetical protein
LKKGGKFLIVENHPLASVLADNCKPGKWRIGYSYFDREMMTLLSQGSYASNTQFDKPMQVHEWHHTMGDIINSLTGAGLQITSLQEYPYCMFKRFPWMVQDKSGWWRAPGGDASIPFLFSLQASK